MAKKPEPSKKSASEPSKKANIEDEAFEWAARELFEALKGEGSWRRASTPDRSKTRLHVRIVLATLDKYGWVLVRKSSR